MQILKYILRRLQGTWTSDRRVQLDAATQLIAQGEAAEDIGDFEQARRCYEDAISKAPQLSKAHMNLGNLYLARQSVDKALASYIKAIEYDRNSAPAHYNLGNAHWHKRDYESALHCYRDAAAIDPQFDLPWIAMANTFGGLDRNHEAIEACRHAINIAPKSAEAYVVLSMIQYATGKIHEAIASIRVAIELRPEHPVALTNLAGYLRHIFQNDEAIACYRRACEIHPENPENYTALLFLLSHDPSTNSEALFREHVAIGSRIDSIGLPHQLPHENDMNPDRVLRVGFVSADFRNHAVMTFIEPIMEFLSERRSDFDFYAYYNSHDYDDRTARVQSLMRHWRDVVNLSDADLHQQIRSDQIDILIDLSGHTTGQRLNVFARKPAPIQASWIGYPGTTGMRSMDYYIGDPIVVPLNTFEPQFTESLVHLPGCAMYQPHETSPNVNELPAAERGYITFGSFNRPDKINRHVVNLWAQLLKKTPLSRMLLAGMGDDFQTEILKQWFDAEGIDDTRLIFHRRCNIESYLMLHHEVDLCLDTFPYTGGTTTLHAMWMGVPTLTLAGTTPMGRQTACGLAHVDLNEFVAGSPEEFVRKGCEWTSRRSDLAEIRTSLRMRLRSSGICNSELISNGLAQALRIMWRRWCANLPVGNIDVSVPRMSGTTASS